MLYGTTQFYINHTNSNVFFFLTNQEKNNHTQWVKNKKVIGCKKTKLLSSRLVGTNVAQALFFNILVNISFFPSNRSQPMPIYKDILNIKRFNFFLLISSTISIQYHNRYLKTLLAIKYSKQRDKKFNEITSKPSNSHPKP